MIVGLTVMSLVGIATCALRWHEFKDLIFWWNDNSYASCIWIALGTHATYLLAATIEFLLMLIWCGTHELDPHHGLDVTLCGGYWYWTTAVYVIVYAVVFLSPRWL